MNNLRQDVNIDHPATLLGARIAAYVIGAPLLMLTWDLLGSRVSPPVVGSEWLILKHFFVVPALISFALSGALLLWQRSARETAMLPVLTITLLVPFLLLVPAFFLGCALLGACL